MKKKNNSSAPDESTACSEKLEASLCSPIVPDYSQKELPLLDYVKIKQELCDAATANQTSEEKKNNDHTKVFWEWFFCCCVLYSKIDAHTYVCGHQMNPS